MTTYRTEYESELIGPLTLASDGEAIVGCWFGNDRYFGYGVDGEMEPNDDLPVATRESTRQQTESERKLAL